MSTATRRSLQVEERRRASIRSKGHARSNGNGHACINGNNHRSSAGSGHVSSNGNGHVRRNGNGHVGLNGNGRSNGTALRNVSNGNGASCNRVKPRVFVAAENRLLREALSRMLTKNGDIEVITSEAAELFPKSLQASGQSPLQRKDASPSSEPGTPALPNLRCGNSPLLQRKSGARLGGHSQNSFGKSRTVHSFDRT